MTGAAAMLVMLLAGAAAAPGPPVSTRTDDGASPTLDGEGHGIADTGGRTPSRRGRHQQNTTADDDLHEGRSRGAEPAQFWRALTTARRTYTDVPAAADGLVTTTQEDALHYQTKHVQDGLHREVRTVDALQNETLQRYDAAVVRLRRNQYGEVTTLSYDAINRLLGREDTDGTQHLAQSTTYDDAARTETSYDWGLTAGAGVPTLRQA